MIKEILSLLVVFILAGGALTAQYPPRSPYSFIRQAVGNTMVTVEYAKPMVRGREIFGALVPYNERWQYVASSVVFSLDGEIEVAGQTVPSGFYSLMIVPGETEWTVTLNTATHGTGNYDPAEDAMQVCVPVKKPGRFYESFSLEFDTEPNGATLYISWADVQVSIPFTTKAEETAMAHIDDLIANEGTAEEYFRAANHLIFIKKDLDKVLTFTERLMAVESEEYIWRMRKDVFAYRGEKQKALAAIDKAEELVRMKFSGDHLAEKLVYWEAERARIMGN